jgi:hypothetical protein
MPKNSIIPQKRTITSLAFVVLGSFLLATQVQKVFSKRSKAIKTHAAENQKSNEPFLLDKHPELSGFTHILLCYAYADSKKSHLEAKYIDCPAGKEITLYNYGTSTKVPEQKGKFVKRTTGEQNIQFYNYQYHYPRASEKGRICTSVNNCVGFESDLSWIKKNIHPKYGMVMLTALIFTKDMELDGTVDLTMTLKTIKDDIVNVNSIPVIFPGDYLKNVDWE